jgi:RNA polymerase sigma-70 factor (ECF subfamily)
MDDHQLDFETFFRAEYPSLVSALAVAIGSRDTAADVVQEAFIRASTRWTRVGRLDRPGAWVRMVALNLATDHRRRLVRRRRVAPLLLADEWTEPAHPDRDLADALAALPPRQRLAVVLHYLLDLPVAQVAAELGISAGTVKASLHSARANLRDRLEVSDG